jgi:L-2,4-diaminobutyrate decarboxylase
MKNLLQEAYSSENFRKNAHELVDLLADYLDNVQSGAVMGVIPWQNPEESLAYWEHDFQESLVVDPAGIFKDIIQKSVHLHHPQYMGHQVSPPLPLASLSGLLTGLLNNGMAVYEMGMVSNPHEKIVTDLLAERIGFDKNASGFLTSGGTLANLTALLTARSVKSNVWDEGTEAKLAILVSEEAHYCIDRAARIMGLGSKGIVKIPVNKNFQMRTDLLDKYYEETINRGFQVIAVIGSACSTSTGAYDDLKEIATFCRKYDLWFHVDAAHGGGVVFSDKYKSLVNGIENADSVVVDFHKMLMIPALATAVVYKKNEDSYLTFQQKAQYLWSNQASQDWYNSGKRTFECTKLMMSVKIYTILRTYGEAIFRENVDTLYDLGKEFAHLLKQNSYFELATESECNIVCFRYKPEGFTEERLNAINGLIRQKLLEQGNFYIVQTTLQHQLYLRVSIMNPFTQLDHLKCLLKEIEKIAESILKSV